jgi:hypothetical protein
MNREINFAEDATEGSDCVLLVAMSGDPQQIKERLIDMAAEIDAPYGKPKQEIASRYKLTCHVITPIWKGRTF